MADDKDTLIKCPPNQEPNNCNNNLPNVNNRPILVLINPRSGKGNSVEIYTKKILPFLVSKQIEHQVFITEENIRVQQYLKTIEQDLSGYKSIIVVSGDGLFYETLNSIMKLANCEQIIEHIPLGVIPTGSGNGLAYTLLRQIKPTPDYNEDEAIKICCEQAIQDEYILADLVRITINNGQSTLWSFLSIGWGLLSDIDIDSEWLRGLGLLRFSVYGLLRSLTSVSYLGRLSYKPIVMTKGGDHQQIKASTKIEDNNYINDDNSKKQKSDTETNTASNQNFTISDYEENNDNNWVHIEDKFACIYAVFQAYISSVTHFAPNSTLTDQIIHLTFIRGKLSPCQIVKFLLAIEDGSHEKLPFVTVVPVEKLKIEPLEESRIVVDGEVIPWKTTDGPISAEIVPRVLKLRWNPNLSISNN